MGNRTGFPEIFVGQVMTVLPSVLGLSGLSTAKPKYESCMLRTTLGLALINERLLNSLGEEMYTGCASLVGCE